MGKNDNNQNNEREEDYVDDMSNDDEGSQPQVTPALSVMLWILVKWFGI